MESANITFCIILYVVICVFLKKLLKFYLSKIFIKPQIYQYRYLWFLFSKPEVILSIPVYETAHNLGMF